MAVARGASVPAPLEGPATGIEALLAETTHDLLNPGSVAAAPITSEAAVPGAAALAGAPGRTAIGLPARLRTPWGTVALAEALEDARRYLDPVRANTVTTWRVDPGLTTAAGAGPAG